MISAVTTLMLTVALAADAQPVKPQNWQNPATWQRIKTGQTPSEVRKILGEPTATESTKAIEAWYYGDAPKADENGSAERPEHGCLMFRRTPTAHVLQKWVQPNWQILPTWEQLQDGYKQALADQRAAQTAERKRLAEEAAAARTRQAEETRIRMEQQRKERAEKRAQQMALAQQKNIPSEQAEIPKSQTGKASNWFLENIFILSCSSAFLVLLIVFVYKQ